MTASDSEKTSGWQALAYLLFLIAGLMEVWLQWTRNFDPHAFSGRLDLVVLYLPPLAIVASLLSLFGSDRTPRLLAGGFLVVVIFQFAFSLLPYWGLDTYLVYGLLNGFDTAWGVMCVVAWPVSMLRPRWGLSGWQVSALVFAVLIAFFALLGVGWQPEREAFRWNPPRRQGAQDFGLNYAACEGDLAKIERLVAGGARVDAEDPGGWTPLMFAAEKGRGAVVRELLEQGASPDAQEFLHGRRWTYKIYKSSCLPDTTVPTHGATALMIAAVNGHVDIVRMLLEAGADPRAVNEEGRTALELAEAAGQPEVVNLLRQPQVREGR